ncbi:MAG: putative glycoside hydrolase, partial [Henriciella sp.]
RFLDVAIVVFGEDPYAEFRGDVEHLGYDIEGSKEIELLRKLKADGIPTVSVFLSGRPMWVNPELNASDAFVAAWLPGSEGTGVADVLIAAADGTPRHDFTGKLSYSWPKRPDQGPLNVGDENYDPLFAYGYGLSYAAPGEVAALDETVPETLSTGGSNSVFFTGGAYSTNMRAFTSDGVSEARVDHLAQEDAASFTFPEAGGWVSFTDGTVSDYVRESNADIELLLTLRSSLSAPVSIGLGCEGDDCQQTRDFSPAALGNGDWTDIRISLSCFGDIDLSAISAPVYIETSGAGQLAISNAQLVEDADASETCPGD